MPYGVTRERVHAAFTRFGEIAKDNVGIPDISIRYRRNFPNKPGIAFGFLRFKEITAASAALQAKTLNLDGNIVQIQHKTSNYHIAPAFTHELPTHYEVVLSVPMYDLKNPRIHSLWPCNIVNGRVISLQNLGTIPYALVRRIENFCCTGFPNWSIRERFWRPSDDSPPINIWVNAVGKHNVYEENFFMKDYFQVATDLSVLYIHQIPDLVDDFKVKLQWWMNSADLYKGKPFSAEIDALDLFVSEAKLRFKKVIRVSVVFDEKDGEHIEIARFYA